MFVGFLQILEIFSPIKYLYYKGNCYVMKIFCLTRLLMFESKTSENEQERQA